MSNWEIYEVRPADNGSEYIIEAWHFVDDQAGLSVWANLRVRESGNPNQLELIGVEIGGMHYVPMETIQQFEVPIPVDEIRSLPYAHLISRAQLLLGYKEIDEDAPDVSLNDVDLKALREEWPRGDVESVANTVGVLYRMAIADGSPAQKVVQDAFDVSRATAGRMISKARELGYIRVQGVVGRPRKGNNNGKDRT